MQTLIKFKKIIFSLLFTVISLVVFFLVFNQNHINIKKENQKPNFALTNYDLVSNNQLEIPILCNYDFNEATNTIRQDCNNLLLKSKKFITASIQINGFFKMETIEIIDQNNRVVDSAKIISFSLIPFTTTNYSNQCKNYCPPSRMYFQFEVWDDVQLQGIRISNFRFQQKLQKSAITNYDPTKIYSKIIITDKRLMDYDEIVDTLKNANSNDPSFIIENSYSTPTSANQGLSSASIPGIQIELNFFSKNNSLDKISYNTKHHSFTNTQCKNKIKKDLIKGLDEEQICNYLVEQRLNTNQAGDADFIIELTTSFSLSTNKPFIITPLTKKYFEEFLFGYEKISINQLSFDFLNEVQWKIFSVLQLSNQNTILKDFKLKINDLTEDNLNVLFKYSDNKEFYNFDLSNNEMVLTKSTSDILEKLKIVTLNLENNTLQSDFSFTNKKSELKSINVRNTGWELAKSSTLWTNLDKIEIVILTGTAISDITLATFTSLLVNANLIRIIEADFSDTNNLDVSDFYTSFSNLERFNVPLSKYEISNLSKFLNDSKQYQGKVGLPLNGTTFASATAREIFNASAELKDKITDINGNSKSLYYDFYISFLFRNFLNQRDFFNDEFALDHKEEAIDEVVKSYHSLFNAANARGEVTDSFNIQHERLLESFETVAKLIEANIQGKLITNFIEENNQIKERLNLGNIPSISFIQRFISIIILILMMFVSLIVIIWVLFFKFFIKL